MSYESIFQTTIETLEAEGRYRIFAELERPRRAFLRDVWATLTILAAAAA